MLLDVSALGVGGESGKVREQDRNEPALTFARYFLRRPYLLRFGERGTAIQAEPRARRIGLTARRTPLGLGHSMTSSAARL